MYMVMMASDLQHYRWIVSQMEYLLYNRANYVLFNKEQLTRYFKFLVDGFHVGFIRKDYWPILKEHGNQVFVPSDCCEAAVTLNPYLSSSVARGNALQSVMEQIKEKDLIECLRGWRNEKYNVVDPKSLRPLFQLERVACTVLGVSKFGSHVNGYVKKNDRLFMWIGTRSATKPTQPGKLDNMAAGGLTWDKTALQCAVNECEEEAGVERDYALDNLKSCGTVSCFFEDDRGVNPETEYVFDLRLPEDFIPMNQDGEVDEFQLIPVEDLISLVTTPKFKVNSALCVVDFLVRHGILTADNCDLDVSYSRIVSLLHLMHPFD